MSGFNFSAAYGGGTNMSSVVKIIEIDLARAAWRDIFYPIILIAASLPSVNDCLAVQGSLGLTRLIPEGRKTELQDSNFRDLSPGR